MALTLSSSVQQLLLHSSQYFSRGNWQYCQDLRMGSPCEGALCAWLRKIQFNNCILASLNRSVTCSWAAGLCLHAPLLYKRHSQTSKGTALNPCICCLNATVLLQDGLSLEGLEGEVLEVVKEYQGKNLTANLPYKVQLLLDNDGKKSKFFAHLVSPCSPLHAAQMKMCWPELLLLLCGPQLHPAFTVVSSLCAVQAASEIEPLK